VSIYGVKLERSDQLRLPRHPDAPEDFLAWCRGLSEQGVPLAVDLFAGAGGLSLGLENAGWAIVAAVDNDPRSVETHAHNFPGQALNLDLADVTARQGLFELLDGVDIDLVAGGPPCQPFSRAGSSKIRSLVNAGSRPGTDARRELWRVFVQVVVRLRPRVVLMENVPDMALGDGFRAIREMVYELEENGYSTDISFMDTWRHGVPQHRRRLILQARRDGRPFREPRELPKRTLGDAIGDLPPLGATTGSREMRYYPPEQPGEFLVSMRAGAPKGVVHDHMARPVRADDREIFQYMTPKMLYTEVPAHLRRYTTKTFDDKYKRLDEDDLSRTITAHIAKDGYWYIHPSEARTLTVREAARVQTFPDRFRFAGHRSDAFRQIGNAVPPGAAEMAARSLRTDSEGTEKKEPTCVDWRTVRAALDRWADDERNLPWSARPGLRPLAAMAAAVLSGARARQDETTAATEALRERDMLTPPLLQAAITRIGTPGGERALRRLEPLLNRFADDDAPKLVELRPAEASIYHLLRGTVAGESLLTTTTTVRVASRFLDTKSRSQEMLTAGRIDLARLVGSGEGSMTRMAALRQIGRSVCGPAADPICDQCPLAAWCRYRARRVSETLPFEEVESHAG